MQFWRERIYRERFLTNHSVSGFLVRSGIASYSNSEVFFIFLQFPEEKRQVMLKCFSKIEAIIYILYIAF